LHSKVNELTQKIAKKFTAADLPAWHRHGPDIQLPHANVQPGNGLPAITGKVQFAA
jgi:hypothetical protein